MGCCGWLARDAELSSSFTLLAAVSGCVQQMPPSWLGWASALEGETWDAIKERALVVTQATTNVVDKLTESAETMYTTASIAAEKQLHHASVALLHSEIGEKKREWGERAFQKMKDGDLAAVTALFEHSQREVEDLEKQIEAKQQQIAELDAGEGSGLQVPAEPPERAPPRGHLVAPGFDDLGGGGGVGAEGRVDREHREAREAAAREVAEMEAARLASSANPQLPAPEDEVVAAEVARVVSARLS